MRRAPGRARGAREHDAQHVGMLVLVGERAEAQQVIARGGANQRRTYGVAPDRVALPPLESRKRVAKIVLERERIVRARLHAHQQAVERRDVDAGRVEAALECLDERRSRAGERIEHRPRAGT